MLVALIIESNTGLGVEKQSDLNLHTVVYMCWQIEGWGRWGGCGMLQGECDLQVHEVEQKSLGP